MRLEAVVAVEEEALAAAIEVVAAAAEVVSVIEVAVAAAEVLVTEVAVAVVEVLLSHEPQDQHLRRVFLIITSRLTIVFSPGGGFGDRGGRGGGRGFGGGRGAPRGGAGGGRGGKPGMRGGAKVIIVSPCSLSVQETSEPGSHRNPTDTAFAQLRSPTDMAVSLSLAAARKISWSPRTLHQASPSTVRSESASTTRHLP